MAKKYEYIQLRIEVGDLKELNGLASAGFRIAAMIKLGDEDWALLEREIANG